MMTDVFSFSQFFWQEDVWSSLRETIYIFCHHRSYEILKEDHQIKIKLKSLLYVLDQKNVQRVAEDHKLIPNSLSS